MFLLARKDDKTGRYWPLDINGMIAKNFDDADLYFTEADARLAQLELGGVILHERELPAEIRERHTLLEDL